MNYLARAALAAKPSTGANVDVCTTGDVTRTVAALVICRLKG